MAGCVISVITAGCGFLLLIYQMVLRLHSLWRVPLYTTVAISFIHRDIGNTVFLAVGLMFTVVPILLILAKRNNEHR